MASGVSKGSVLPGFRLTLGITILYLALLVLLPLSTVFLKTATLSWVDFWRAITAPRVLAAYRLSFGCAFFAAALNAVFGVLIAWVLVRYHFPLRRLVDGLIDLPFALPTAVAGIALTSLYAENGFLGRQLAGLGIKVAFTPLGVFVALTFVGLPFVVRTVQPILQDLDPEIEEASACLGASAPQTFFKVILPLLWPGVLTGFSLAFARALGEYGSVIFISGNMPKYTEIVPLLIVMRLEEYQYAEAAALAMVMLAASFMLMLAVNVLQFWASRRAGGK